MVHTRRMKKPSRPSIKPMGDRLTPERFNERIQRRSASPEIERAPHSELAIVDYSMENSMTDRAMAIPNGESAMRRKLYFNPVFFESEHLKVNNIIILLNNVALCSANSFTNYFFFRIRLQQQSSS